MAEHQLNLSKVKMKYIIKTGLLLIASLFIQVSDAQPIYKLWDNTIQGSGNDGLHLEMTKLTGDRILAACLTSSDSGYDKTMDYYINSTNGEPWVMILDGNGNKIWDRDFYVARITMGLALLDSMTFVLSCTAPVMLGGDLTAPLTPGSAGNESSWLVSFNSSDSVYWNKRFSAGTVVPNNFHFLRPLDIKTVDGNIYALAVVSRNADIMTGGDFTALNCVTGNNLNNTNILFYKVNPNDSLYSEWQYAYGGDSSEFPVFLYPIGTDGFLLGGMTVSQASCNQTVSSHTYSYYDYYIIRVDATGNIMWQQRYGGSKNDYLNGILDAGNGDFLLYGRTTSPMSFDITSAGLNDTSIWIVKINSSGNIIWDKSLGACNAFSYLGNEGVSVFSSALYGSNTIAGINTSDGGYLFVSNVSNSQPCGDVSEPGQGYEDYWMIKLDSAGNKVWDKRFGGPGYDVAERVVEMSPGYYIVGGYSRGSNTATRAAGGDKSEVTVGGMDLWFIGVADSAAILASTGSIAHPNLEMMLYPNPAVKEVNIKIENNPIGLYQLKLFDITGKVLLQQQMGATSKINIETFSPGIFIVEVCDKLGNKGRGKLVKW